MNGWVLSHTPLLVRHQLSGCLVHQVTVLDALGPGIDCPLDGGRGIGVHRDIGVAIGGRFDAGAQLRDGEGHHVQGRTRRGDPAAANHLYLRGPEEQLLAHTQAHLVDAVGDGSGARAFELALRAAGASRNIRIHAHVAVAAGRGDHRPARIDARTDGQPGIDRLLQREGGSAQIPYGREAPHQSPLGLGAGGKVDEADVGRQQLRRVQAGEHHVPVRVDQARHQHAPAAIDQPRALRRALAGRRDLLDPSVFNPQALAAAQTGGFAVEQLEVSDDSRRRGPRRLRARPGSESEAGERAGRACEDAAARKLPRDPSIRGSNCRLAAKATGRARLGLAIRNASKQLRPHCRRTMPADFPASIG